MLYGIRSEELQLYPEYEGCQNLVFFYASKGIDYVLRVSFRTDRPPKQIHAELDFVLFLHENGVRVCPPAKSLEGRYADVLWANGMPFTVVAFTKAPGYRVPDRDYKYRDGVDIKEYYHNWGNILGQMHRLTQQYTPKPPITGRPLLLDTLSDHYIPRYLPSSLDKVKGRFLSLIKDARELPCEKTAFGLIHADFSDGNFCVDYTNGNITVFDFDDSAYCWFMYDLADAWRSGTGRIQFEQDTVKRRDFMDRYFETLIEGYTKEISLSDEWLNRLPMFIKLVEMEAVLSEFQYLSQEEDDEEDDEELAYSLKCIEEGIPFLGFFDSIYSHKHPFSLPCT